MKELSTIFAHFAYENGARDESGELTKGIKEMWRQGLYHVEEDVCAPNGFYCGTENCDFYNAGGWIGKAFPRSYEKSQFFGRGAFFLKWNYNYGPFSKVMFEDEYVLLNEPERVSKEAWLAFATAFW